MTKTQIQQPAIRLNRLVASAYKVKIWLHYIRLRIHLRIPRPILLRMPHVAVQFGNWKGATYYHTHDAGLFSNFSTIFYEVARLHPRAKRVDLSKSFTFFKDQPGSNCWGEYFQSLLPPIHQFYFEDFSSKMYHHADYTTMNFKEASRGLTHYFRPSDRVHAQMAEFVKKYTIDFDKTICVCYRGTDKHTEISPVDPSEYVRAVKSLMDQNPDFRVFVQTDQRQVREMMMAEFGDRAFFIAEIPVTSGQMVMHKTLSTDQLDFGVKLFAAVLMMARCKYLITHTGNIAFWSVLYRGHAEGVLQFRGGPGTRKRAPKVAHAA